MFVAQNTIWCSQCDKPLGRSTITFGAGPGTEVPETLRLWAQGEKGWMIDTHQGVTIDLCAKCQIVPDLAKIEANIARILDMKNLAPNPLPDGRGPGTEPIEEPANYPRMKMKMDQQHDPALEPERDDE